VRYKVWGCAVAWSAEMQNDHADEGCWYQELVERTVVMIRHLRRVIKKVRIRLDVNDMMTRSNE